MAEFLTAGLLRGRFVALEPYVERLKREVGEALDGDPEAWDLFAICGAGEHFETWWARAETDMRAGIWISYAIRRLSDRRIVGSTSFLNIDAQSRTVEIGATFLHRDVRGDVVNPEAKRLMLGFAFECGANRVTLVTDARNARSRAAIAKLGARQVEIVKSERVTWTGHLRDSVVFEIRAAQWPQVRQGLDERLDQHDGDLLWPDSASAKMIAEEPW